MSESAEIVLTGKSVEQLKTEIKKISDWDNQRKYDIRVFAVKDGAWIYDSIGNVEAAIYGDLEAYIKTIPKSRDSFVFPDAKLKTEPNTEKINAPAYERMHKNKNKKRRNPMTHLTPKKKKRRR